MESCYRDLNYLKRSGPQNKELHLAYLEELTVRCGLPTSHSTPKIVLSEEHLQGFLKKNELLITTSIPIIKKVFDNFEDQTVLFMLCNVQGYIFHLASSLEIFQWFFERGIKLGTCMDYRSSGINAMSLAIYADSSAMIIGQDHSNNFLKKWSCIAAPIKVEEKTTGFISIFSESESDIKKFRPFIEMTGDLIALQYKNYEKTNAPMDSTLFFGALILDHQLNFTFREIEILYMLYSGKNLAALQGIMAISPNTIKTHLKSIYSKLGVNKLNDCVTRVKSILLNKGIKC